MCPALRVIDENLQAWRSPAAVSQFVRGFRVSQYLVCATHGRDSEVLTMRRRASGLVVVMAVLLPSATHAQAPWVPPRGEATIGSTYQWLDADRHLFSQLTGPELTPLEIARHTDYQTNSLDFGRVQSHAVLVGGDVGLTDRLAVSASLALISPRYRGAFPHPGPADDGNFHTTLQDLQVGARYMFATDAWAVTPFSVFTTPVAEYEVLAHAAQGQKLKQLEVGTSIGRILVLGGAAKGYVQGLYGYSIVESLVEDVSLNRSRAAVEAGYFLGRLTLQGSTSWRRVHGGFEWSDIAFGAHEHFEGHDQSAAIREWRWGAGVSLQVTPAASLEVSYGDFINGANTHDARVIAIGWTQG